MELWTQLGQNKLHILLDLFAGRSDIYTTLKSVETTQKAKGKENEN